MSAVWAPPLLARDHPPASDCPYEWKLIEAEEDGRAYRHRTGLTLIWSVAYEQDGKAWRHVSIAHPHRLPTWTELGAVKDWVCGADAVVYQVLPPAAEYVNDHEYCLHLWQPLGHRPLPDFRRLGTI